MTCKQCGLEKANPATIHRKMIATTATALEKMQDVHRLLVDVARTADKYGPGFGASAPIKLRQKQLAHGAVSRSNALKAAIKYLKESVWALSTRRR